MTNAGPFCRMYLIKNPNFYWLMKLKCKPLVCMRARTRAGAAIFVQIGAGIFLEMCVRVRA
jgi:hypothetical protein